jgi:hypothetical protein
MDKKIVHPIGWAAGREDEVFQVLWNISIEMMGHRSDLREEAIREKHKSGGIPLFVKMDAAELLEKYAVAVTIAALQIMTPNQQAHCHISGLEELAKKYDLFLPDFKSEVER